VALLGIEYRIRFDSFSFTLAELSLPLALVALLFGIRKGLTKQFDSLYFVALIMIAMFGLTSVLAAPDTLHAMSVYRDLLAPCLFFGILLSIPLSRHDVSILVKAYVAVATINACLGIVQFYTGQFVWFHEPDGYVSEAAKVAQIRQSVLGALLGIKDNLPVGLYAGMNNFASYLVPPCLMSLALSRMKPLSKRSRFGWRAATVILTFGLILTFSRASVLSLGLGIPLTIRAIAKARLRVAVTGLVLLVGLAIMVAVIGSGVVSWDDLGTGAGRIDMVTNGLAFLESHPIVLLLGGGTWNYFAEYSATQVVHNLCVYLVLQFGVVVAGAWLFIVTTAQLRAFRQLPRVEGNHQLLALALWASAFVTLYIYGQTASFADMVQAAMWLFLLQALAIHLLRREPALMLVRPKHLAVMRVIANPMRDR
jgi:hypothetical protein